MIIVKIPKRREYREFILQNVKKMKRNMKHKYIKLEAEAAYSSNYVYFIFPPRCLELAFALSIYLKCQKHQIPCELYLAKSIKLDEISPEVLEAAQEWSERKPQRKYYKLRKMQLE